MICQKCYKNESTYDAPEKWCDKCWSDWWFEGYTEEQRAQAEPFLFVCRAYRDLGDGATNDQILHHVMQVITKGGANPNDIREAIEQYREFEKDPSK